MENRPNKIIIHHTADSFNGNQFDKVNRFHQSQGFPQSSLGFYGGYHAIIEKSGVPKFYRGDSDEGAHAKGINLESIGIALAGDFNIEHPNERQLDTLGKILQDYQQKHKIPNSQILLHRDFSQTTCPGEHMTSYTARCAAIKQENNFLKQILSWIIETLKSFSNS